VRTIEFQQRVARTRVDACKLLEFSALRERAVGSRSASVDARQDLSSASSAAAAWPRSTSTPASHKPGGDDISLTPEFLFWERGDPYPHLSAA
jgi:hypothetical protein